MWTPLDTSLLIIFFVFSAVFIACLFLVILPHYDTDHFEDAQCKVTNMDWIGNEYCTNCYTEDTGTTRKKRSFRSQGGYPHFDEEHYLETHPKNIFRDLNATKDKNGTVKGNSRQKRDVCFDSISGPSFPCVKIMVNYTAQGAGEEQSAVLHMSIEELYKYPQCSLSSCMSSYDNNEISVRQTSDDWQKYYLSGQSFTCYYNPHRPAQVLSSVIPYEAVLHSISWPATIMGACFLCLIIRRCYHCWHLANQIEDESDEDKQNNLQEAGRSRYVKNTNERSSKNAAARNGPNNELFIVEHEDRGPTIHPEQVAMSDRSQLSTVVLHRNSDVALMQDVPNIVDSGVSDNEKAGVAAVRHSDSTSSKRKTQDGEKKEKREKKAKKNSFKNEGEAPVFEQSQTVSYMDNGIVKYSFNYGKNEPQPSTSGWKAESNDKAGNLPAPKPGLGSMQHNDEPPVSSSAQKLPPLRGVAQDVSEEDALSKGRKTRKERAAKLREEKKKQRGEHNSSESDEKSQNTTSNNRLEDVNMDTSKTTSKYEDEKMYPILNPLSNPQRERSGSNATVVKYTEAVEPKQLHRDPLSKYNYNSYARSGSGKSNRADTMRARDKSNEQADITAVSNANRPSSGFRLPDEPDDTKVNQMLKFSRHSGPEPAVTTTPPSTAATPQKPAALKPLEHAPPRKVGSGMVGAPVATGNARPHRPLSSKGPRRLNVNVTIPDIKDNSSVVTKEDLALKEVFGESAGRKSPATLSYPRPKSRSQFRKDSQDDQPPIAINYRPQNMYGDLIDSDSLPSHQSNADPDTDYMNNLGPEPFDLGHVSDNGSTASFATKFMRHSENIANLPSQASLNMRILEYVANSGLANPSDFRPESQASHVSFSDTKSEALSENVQEEENIIIRTSDGQELALPPGAKIVGGTGMQQLSVQNGDETYVLPIPDNAQYIVYEYIEEGSTSETCSSSCCSNEQCSQCGGERRSMPDDVTMEDL